MREPPSAFAMLSGLVGNTVNAHHASCVFLCHAPHTCLLLAQSCRTRSALARPLSRVARTWLADVDAAGFDPKATFHTTIKSFPTMMSPLKYFATGSRQVSSVMLSIAGVRCERTSVLTPAS